jgi:L-asparaginase
MITSSSLTSPPSVRILVTGETFDKRYDELRGVLAFQDSSVPTILKHARSTAPLVVEVLQLIDSLDMTDADRDRVAAACWSAPEAHVVIIHGTDTMTVTAARLQQEAIPRTIVLTGAMVPFAVHGTDLQFNLGYAVAAAQHLPSGVYVAMNGRTFDARRVRKNSDLGVFEFLSTSPGTSGADTKDTTSP